MRLSPTPHETPLEAHVRRWLNLEGREYANGWRGALADLQQGGCQSGMVSHLVYYKDTLTFYKQYSEEINDLLKDCLSNYGFKHPKQLLKDWDSHDPLGQDTHNKNLLAWFAFEETAYRIGCAHGA
jgi:hypothetical protein